MALSGGLALRLIWLFGLVAFAPLGGGHQSTVLAVRGKHTMEAGQVDPGLGHQRSEPGNEVEGLKEYMRGAIPVRLCLLVSSFSSDA